HRGRPASLPSDLDDGLRLHHRRRATHGGQRRRRGRAERDGHRRVRGDADRHCARRVHYPGQLFLRGVARPAPRPRGATGARARHPGAGPRRAPRMRRRAVVAVALVLGGCTLGPDYTRPAVTMPASFRGAGAETAAETLADIEWWRLFPDETLQGLIRVALRENYDLQLAAARILDARAQVTIARSF